MPEAEEFIPQGEIVENVAATAVAFGAALIKVDLPRSLRASCVTEARINFFCRPLEWPQLADVSGVSPEIQASSAHYAGDAAALAVASNR